ncbi:oxidoreductase [Fibrobacterales bacterium]|nr:oxidoreductase [Fibrobacterales bacterium]
MPSLQFSFPNKTVVITGGANGIGKSIAEHFQNAGAKVAVIDKEIANGANFFFQGDIAEESVLREFAKQVVKKFDKVDFLINDASVGLAKKGILSDCSFDDFVYVQKVGVAAPYLLTQLFLPYFTKNAAVVNLSSTRAFQSQPDTESYSASKGGIVSLTHALAVSLAGMVRVNAISPGWVDTAGAKWSKADQKQQLAGRIGTPADIANMTLYLCSDAAGFITGQNFTIDGGMGKLMVYHNDFGWKFNPTT